MPKFRMMVDAELEADDIMDAWEQLGYWCKGEGCRGMKILGSSSRLIEDNSDKLTDLYGNAHNSCRMKVKSDATTARIRQEND